MLIISSFCCAGCEKTPDSAMSRLMRAREEYNIYTQYSQGALSRQKKAYALYKKVFLKNRAVMTHKNIAQMYVLGTIVEKDEAFLKKIKTIYDRERKIAQK